jgi:hypothetical protein
MDSNEQVSNLEETVAKMGNKLVLKSPVKSGFFAFLDGPWTKPVLESFQNPRTGTRTKKNHKKPVVTGSRKDT